MLSKPWDWTKDNSSRWNTPTAEFYYYAHRWIERGYVDLLDLGCGMGRHAVAFAERGFQVSGCDLSEYAIERTNERAAFAGVSVRTDICDIISLPYADDSFDCIFSYHVISHTDSEGIKSIIGEIKRTLRRGGEIFVDLVAKASPIFKRATEFIDENTFVMTEIEAEKGLPHYCVDYRDIFPLFEDFEILRIEEKAEYDVKEHSYNGVHYYILARRK